MRIPLLIITLFLTSCVSIPSVEELRTNLLPDSSLSGSPNTPGPPLKIYIPTIGQGDATLIVLPNGKTMLIDAGPPDAGPQGLLPLLEELQITRLDALLITHYDDDHLGGVPALLAGKDGTLGTEDDIRPALDLDRGGTPWDNSPGLDPYLGSLTTLNIPRNTLEPGERLILDSEVEIQCVAVNGIVFGKDKSTHTVDLTPNTYSGQENASSIALLITYKDFRYLTAGDLTGGGSLDGFLTPDVETLLADAVGKVNVVHVNHHGSLSSSNPYFVETTAPQAIFIQAGKNNPYGHPVPEVVERWRNVGVEVYSTIDGGGYVLTSDGVGFEIGGLQ